MSWSCDRRDNRHFRSPWCSRWVAARSVSPAVRSLGSTDPLWLLQHWMPMTTACSETPGSLPSQRERGHIGIILALSTRYHCEKICLFRHDPVNKVPYNHPKQYFRAGSLVTLHKESFAGPSFNASFVNQRNLRVWRILFVSSPLSLDIRKVPGPLVGGDE